MNIFQNENISLLKYGKLISLMISLITIVTFSCAMIAIPISGSNAPINGDYTYPFLNTIQQYPRDFIWQYVAMIQLIVFIIFLNILSANIQSDKKIYMSISKSIGLLASGVLLSTYYSQVMVIPSSLAANNTDGIGLIIQYNPFGLFIAMEELGYMLMCLSLFSLFPVFSKNKRCLPIKLTIIIASLLAMISFLMITLIHGLNKQDRFEIAIITIVWFTLIIVGFLLNRIFSFEEKCLTTAST